MGPRFSRVFVALVLSLLVFDLVDGASPWGGDVTAGRLAGSNGAPAVRDAECCCARAVPAAPPDLAEGEPTRERVTPRPSPCTAPGFERHPYHPPRTS